MGLASCVPYQTIPDYLGWRNINTPEVCLARCRDRNYTYAGVGNPDADDDPPHAGCYCAHASPEYARVHPSRCWDKCPGTNETCGAEGFFSVVGPGYPSIPAYCAHVTSLPYYQYNQTVLPYNQTLGPEDCIKKCASRGHFSSAGLKGPRCFCGARLPARENAVEESNCNTDCDGRVILIDNIDICGVEDFINVYKVNKTADAEVVAPEPPGLEWQLDSYPATPSPTTLTGTGTTTPRECAWTSAGTGTTPMRV